MCKKIGKKIGSFRRIGSKVNTLTAINIYNAIVKRHFEYDSTIVYTCCNDSHIQRLQKLQNKAMILILKCNKYIKMVEHKAKTCT